ncbi:hypothetical protein HSBAA_61360 [Vreelandella sulfidaeris]|uniref:NYN domain-containing protein n=1 Tax=Vreelandella sulfidaeris TaxID=115553 RepID=A0A455UF47_9GAMM|nr:hypothetical protein HSBAA_61360 [Halomonas sulfidaeris]
MIVLVSGDGDFDLLVNKIRVKYGKEVEVYGVPQFTAASLMNEASEFLAIDENFYWVKFSLILLIFQHRY